MKSFYDKLVYHQGTADCELSKDNASVIQCRSGGGVNSCDLPQNRMFPEIALPPNRQMSVRSFPYEVQFHVKSRCV